MYGLPFLFFYWKCHFPMTPHVRLLVSQLVGPSVSLFVCHNFLQEGGKLHFHAPIGALVISIYLSLSNLLSIHLAISIYIHKSISTWYTGRTSLWRGGSRRRWRTTRSSRCCSRWTGPHTGSRAAADLPVHQYDYIASIYMYICIIPGKKVGILATGCRRWQLVADV